RSLIKRRVTSRIGSVEYQEMPTLTSSSQERYIVPAREAERTKGGDTVPEGALSDLRIVELAEMVAGPFCTKVMADLGAEVLKVESPHAGDPARQRGPFPHDQPHPERSALFLYLNTNKRGITLDVCKPEGVRLFRDLLREADILVETCRPGALAALDLGYDKLKALNPRLIMASITPF